MTNSFKRFLLGGVVSALAASGFFARADDDATPLPNPFIRGEIRQETRMEKLRHAFNKKREAIDKYLEVYPKELDGAYSTTLAEVRKDPTYYLDRKVHFDMIYGTKGSFYRPFTTPFHQEGFSNFSGWEYGAELWDKDVRSNAHPFFYIDKRSKEVIKKMISLPEYTPVHVWAVTRSSSDKQAWIEIIGAEVIDEAPLTESSLRQVELAVRQLERKRYDIAAKSLETALELRLPVSSEANVYPLIARCYFELHKYDQARNALVNSVIRNENNAETLLWLARTDSRLGRGDEALTAAQNAVKLTPANPECHAELGLALAMTGSIRAGYKELETAQRLSPRGKLTEASRNRAVIALMENNPEQARQELNEAVILRATDPDLHIELGDVLVKLNQLEDARREYTQARDLASGRADTHYKVAEGLKIQGDADAKAGKKDAADKSYAEALEAVKESINRDFTVPAAWKLQSDLLKAMGKSSDARKVLEDAARSNPTSISIQEMLYADALEVSDWTAMESATRASLKIRCDARLHSRLGWILSTRPGPDYAGAAEAYAQSVAIETGNAANWAALGHIKVHHLGDFVGGENALAEAVRQNPQDGASWTSLGVARRHNGNSSGAKVAAEEAVKLTHSVSARLLVALTRLDLNTKDNVVTSKWVKDVIADASSGQERSSAQSVLGLALYHEGDTQGALSAFRSADNDMAGYPEHNLGFGKALWATGQTSPAKEKLEKAVSLSAGSIASSRLMARINNEAQQALKTVNTPPKAEAAPAVRHESQPKPAKKAPVIDEGSAKAAPVQLQSK